VNSTHAVRNPRNPLAPLLSLEQVQSCILNVYDLTGSQNFVLLQSVSQSLAGRCAILHLLNIRTAAELHHHGSRGVIFESYVIAELYKSYVNRGEQPPLYFRRDSKGHEVDVVLDLSSRLVPVEVKSARTVAADFFAGLDYWRTLSGNPGQPAILLHGGDRLTRQHNTLVLPWWAL